MAGRAGRPWGRRTAMPSRTSRSASPRRGCCSERTRTKEGNAVKLPGARIVPEPLKREGVNIAFGLPGGAVPPIYDALYDFEGLPHILVPQEAAARHPAEGHAPTTG